MSDLRPWEPLSSDDPADYYIFRVRRQTMRSPRSGREHRFSLLESVDWVNVIVRTAAGPLVFIRQFRAGTGTVTLEIPGGGVDPGESPEAAARRELREETGYTAPRWRYLGCVEPNPAFMNNRCHTYLAEDAVLEAPPDPQGAEELETVLVDPAEVPTMIADGRITHALVVAAFYLADHPPA